MTASAGLRLLGPADVRAAAAAAGLRPVKSLGQNFVVDANTVRRIVRLAALTPEDVVLEVGPGLGSLTLGLLAAAGRVVAVEVDAKLAAALPRTVTEFAPAEAARLTVVTADAAHVRPEALVAGDGRGPTALVANLPYNVAVPVLLHLLQTGTGLRRGMVMVQAEVGQRLAAAPGSRVYGAPSVKIRWYAQVRRVGPVPRTVFWPVPRVDSELVALARRSRPATSASRAQVFAVIDAAFAQRRKTLRSALARWAGSAEAAARALTAAGVDPGARGESLELAQFARIAEERR